MKLYPAERLNMGISAGAVAASWAVTTPEFAGSLALGAAIEAVNFRFLHRAGEGLFEGVINGSGPWVSVLFMRFGLLAGGIWAAIALGANPLALVIGLSLVMPRSPRMLVSGRVGPSPDRRIRRSMRGCPGRACPIAALLPSEARRGSSRGGGCVRPRSR